jgi:streptogramin lyase
LATITEFPVAPSSAPGPITGSTNGYVWFAELDHDTIGRVSPTGAVVEYPLPDSYQEPRGIAAGPSGTVWFTETGSHTGSEGIGRIDASGTITEFPLPDGSVPYGIALGPDGNMWFTQLFGRIGMITPSGTATTFPARLQNEPLNIVSGPDGALWFTEDGIVEGGTGAIGRITTSGDLTEYLLPTPSGLHSGAGDITVGADGNLWFTWVTLDPAQPLATASHSVGRITPAGTITEFPVSAGGGWPPGGIAAGPDGNQWFAQGHANSLGRMSTAGVLTEFPVPTTDGFPADVTVGSDGNVWFSEANARVGVTGVGAPAAGEDGEDGEGAALEAEVPPTAVIVPFESFRRMYAPRPMTAATSSPMISPGRRPRRGLEDVSHPQRGDGSLLSPVPLATRRARAGPNLSA